MFLQKLCILSGLRLHRMRFGASYQGFVSSRECFVFKVFRIFTEGSVRARPRYLSGPRDKSRIAGRQRGVGTLNYSVLSTHT